MQHATVWSIYTKFRIRSKLKVQNSSTSQGPKLHFSSTKIIDKKPYPRHGHSKFRLQCDTEVYCTVLTNTVMIKAKFQNSQDLNSRTFQVLSSTLSVFKHFQGPWSCFNPNSSIFKDFSSTLWTQKIVTMIENVVRLRMADDQYAQVTHSAPAHVTSWFFNVQHGAGQDLRVWRRRTGSLLEAPTHPQML